MGSMPKTKKKNIPKSINEMSKEMLHETLRKKKECNAKALQTVEKLCETNVEEEWFVENLQFINQCHFEDVTIERAISKICGYPLCVQKLDKIPAQQYHISTRYNKVFDITERKNFCSSICYKSAVHVKKQLFTSPLWFRDQEVIPKYTVLKSEKSSMGEEVIFFPDKVKPESEDVKKKEISDKTLKTDANMRKLEEKYSKLKIGDSLQVKKTDNENRLGSENVENKDSNITLNLDKSISNSEEDNSMQKMDNSSEVSLQETISNINNNSSNKNNNFEKRIDSQNVRDNSSDKADLEDKNIFSSKAADNTSEENNLRNSSLKKDTKKESKVKTEVDVIAKIEKCVFEWFSLNTFFYLYGEDKFKQIFQDKASEVKAILNSKLSMAGQNDKIDRMIQLYGLLDADFSSSNEIKTNLKPLPDYSVLKEEGKALEIKVRAFYHGQLEVKPAEKIEDKKEKEEEENKADDVPIYLPLIDAHAQTALRRKIVLDKLNKLLPELIRIYSSEYILQMNEVRNLVSTFTLAANNITFKPAEWNLVGIIIIKLLSLKNTQLNSLMDSESSKSQTSLILMSYQLREDYLENLLLRLTDSANLMEKLVDINK